MIVPRIVVQLFAYEIDKSGVVKTNYIQFSVLLIVRNMTNAVNMELYDFLNDIPETRTRCGFRENMIRQANKPAM